MDVDKIQETENFIQELEQEESLWNVVHPKYRDRNERKLTAERLGNKFGISGKFYFLNLCIIFT